MTIKEKRDTSTIFKLSSEVFTTVIDVPVTFVIDTADDFHCSVHPMDWMKYVSSISDDGESVYSECTIEEFCKKEKISIYRLCDGIADQSAALVWEILCRPRHGGMING